MKLFLLLSILLLTLLGGCTPQVISHDAIVQAGGGPTNFSELRKAPDLFAGKMVILGGVIVKTTNKEEGTLLEVYQTRLDSSYQPMAIDSSEGRFLALHDGFLDSEIYRPGRQVTIAGVSRGERVMKLGEIDYHYPYIVATEINLFTEEQPRAAPVNPPGYYYSPWYPRHLPWYPYGPWYPY